MRRFPWLIFACAAALTAFAVSPHGAHAASQVNVCDKVTPNNCASVASDGTLKTAGGSGGGVGTIVTSQASPTITTGSAYASGNALTSGVSFTGQPQSGVILNALVTFNSGTFSGSVDLVITNAAATGGGTTDHAPFALTATDTAKVVATLHLTDCTTLNSGTIVTCQIPQPFTQGFNNAGTTVFAYPVVRGTPTFTGANDAIFSLITDH